VVNPQWFLKEMRAFIRRRRVLLLVPPIAITLLCAVGSVFLPRMYESSIRILIQRSDVVNPLATLANAISQTNDDPLQSFDEIIFSQRTFEQLMDSLGLTKEIPNEVERRGMMVKIRNSITTKMQERESFSITFQNSDPYRAQRGAYVLANIFIGTITNATIKRNKATVEFYNNKLDDFRKKMEENQQQLMTQMKSSHSGNSSENAALYSRIEQTDQKIRELENRAKDYRQTMTALSAFPSALNTEKGKQTLFEIQRSDVPYAADLKPLISSYDNVTAKYTAKHPEVLKIENEINAVLERMSVAIQSEISKQNSEIDELRKGKASFVEELLKSSNVRQSDQDVESNYLIYQKLYNEMKVKLEEAEISKALVSNVGDQYIIMDPPMLPLFPSKPSRSMIVGGGFVLGILMGILSAIVAEALDTTIRSVQAIEVYGKPIIGFLPYNEEKKK
jgi:uncharacterized protein involved in exopolysaccharide biosynthesis